MRTVIKSRGLEVKYALAIDFKGRMPRLWRCIALALALGLLAGCTGGGGSKAGKSVLKTRHGETGIQVTESEEDGIQVIRITTTFRGEESTVVLAVDQPNYEIEIPLSIGQQRPAGAAGMPRGATPGAASGAGQFQNLLIAQYLERAQAAMINGTYNEALRQVNLVLMVQPDSVPAHSMKGSIYYAMGNFELANEDWEQVLSLDPSNEEVRGFKDFLKNRQGAPQPPLPASLPGQGAAAPEPPRSAPPTAPGGAAQ